MTTSTSPTTLRHETVNLSGQALTIAFADSGSGPAVLVLHGGAGPLSVARIAENLHTSHRVITPVQPGFGGTARPDWFCTIEQVAEAYLGLIRKLGLHQVLVVGSSMGGWIAAEMVARADALFRGAVLIDATGIQVAGETCADVFALTPQEISALSYHDPARFGINIATMSAEQKAGMAANFAALAVYARGTNMHNPTLSDRLAKVRTRALVIWGESDRIVTPQYGKAFANAFAHGDFVLIERCGHMPQIEQPERLMELIMEFDASPVA